MEGRKGVGNSRKTFNSNNVLATATIVNFPHELVESKNDGANLLSILRNPWRRNWKIFQFKTMPTNTQRDAKELENVLNKELNVYFVQKSIVLEHKNTLWGQVGIDLGITESRANIYFVHHPHSKYLFMTNIKNDIKRYLLQAFCNVFGCSDIKPLAITGKDVAGLAEMALHQLSLGSFSAYRLCTSLFDHNPLQSHAHMSKRRRKQTLKIQETVDEERRRENSTDDIVVRETNVREAKRAFSEISDTNIRRDMDMEDPTIQGVCLRLSKDLKISTPNTASKSVKNFKCFVKFEGHDILKGLDSLYNYGMVVEGEEIPKQLDATELITKQLELLHNEEQLIKEPIAPLWLKIS